MDRLTKDERKELRKQEWQDKLEQEQKKNLWKKIGIWVGVILLLVLGFWALNAATTYQPSSASQVNTALPPISPSDITTGGKNAKVTIIEYADFQCPGCAAAHPVVNQLLKDFGSKILYAYRFFPLTTIHKNAMTAAEAGYAAYKQGKFWQMDDLLFNNQNTWAELDDPTSVFLGYAKSLGMNVDQFKSDMNDPKTKAFIEDVENKGTEAGVDSTPTFFVNKKLVNVTNYTDFKNLIQQELNKK